jgi:anti-anti-sigma factor
VAPEPFHPPVFSLDVVSGADGQTLIRAAGELDLAMADKFTAAVRDALTRGGVIVDLSALEFMDSSGVRALDTAVREAAEEGRELRVREAMQPSVVQILELTEMLSLLPMERTR